MPATLTFLPTPDELPVTSTRVHRTPDGNASQRPAPGHKLTAAELAEVGDAFKPYAGALAAQRKNDDDQRRARMSSEPEQRATLDDLATEAEAIKGRVLRTRGEARIAVLKGLEAAARRAGASYHAAAGMLADAAAELEALATFRDSLIGKYDFDALGAWGRSSLVAAPVEYRPKGWGVACNAWGVDCVWVATSPGHTHAVRRTQTAVREEIEHVAASAPWPF